MKRQTKKKSEGIKLNFFLKKLPQCYLQTETARLMLTKSMQIYQKVSQQGWRPEENHQKDLKGLQFHKIKLLWTGNG